MELITHLIQHKIEAFNDVINTFSSLTSGLKINFEKSKSWVSSIVSTNTRNLLANILGIRTDLGFYLGYPFKPTYKKSDFSFTIGKINK